MSRFTPTINVKNVACFVKKVDGTACNHLIHEVDSIRGQQERDRNIWHDHPHTEQLSGRAQFVSARPPHCDLRSNMLASKVERVMFIRLNRYLVDEVHELDAANAQARAMVAKSAMKSSVAQQERSSMSVDLAS